jgi:outer membrane protein OmpA-like peptidoglycan-associated protein
MRVSAGTPASDTARPPNGGPFIRTCAVASVALLVLSGCTGDKKPSKGGSGKPGGAGLANEKAIASQPMAHDDGPVHVDLIAVEKTANDTVTVRLRIVNDGQGTLALDGVFMDTAFRSSATDATNGIALVDGAGNKAYYPLTTDSGTCLCSDLSGAELEPGTSRDVYAVLPAPPDSVRRVAVWAPMTVPFTDVTIGSGHAPPAPDQTLDPARAALGRPNVRTLVSTGESATESVDDDADGRTVRLSADVLFAYNKADLTSRANAVLQDVAEQIDASKGSTVKIDGYTDDSGSDAVNQPLSERRAQAVQDALKAMVTRQGLTFQAAGHGSQNPVAKNDEEPGRKRNRRVTVAFAKPPEPQTPPPASAAGSVPAWTPKGKLPVIAGTRPHFGASASAAEQDANNFRIDVNSVHRDSTGLVTLVWTATNVSGDDQELSGGEFGKYLSLEYSVPFSTSGVSLVDKAGQKRYWPLRDGQGVCLCNTMTEDTGGALTVAANASATFADVYKPPAGVGTTDIEYTWLGSVIPPAAGVPIK